MNEDREWKGNKGNRGNFEVAYLAWQPEFEMSATHSAALVRLQKGGTVQLLVTQGNRRDEDKISNREFFPLHHVFGIAWTIPRLLRKTPTLLLFIYMLCLVLSQFASAFCSVISSLSWAPGVSRTALCYVPTHASWVAQRVDFPKQACTIAVLSDEGASRRECRKLWHQS